MKVLYAFQGTGNGHLARAQEIIPILKKHALVDTLISGHQTQLKSDFDIDYRFKGISLLYNKTGGLSYKKTFLQNNFCKAAKVIKDLDLSAYDLIINDFEPLTGWAAKLKNLPIMELSHQASLTFKETPKPEKTDWLGSLILNNYVPCKKKIGFHFENYNSHIKKPVIRQKIRNLNPNKQGHYLVYLPSFSDEVITNFLTRIDVEWKVFSKYAKQIQKFNNVEVFPIDEKKYLEFFESCEGILCNAGFETPAEALFMNKKLFVIPIENQYEQECNAFALHKMGVANSDKLDPIKIREWINSDDLIDVDYPDNIESILTKEVLY